MICFKYEIYHAPWNSMELKKNGVVQMFFKKFKISFQCSLKHILIKMFHGTFSRVPWNFLNNIWTTPVVPWNSMEFFPDPKFHGIPWNFSILPSSMEFHGTLVFDWWFDVIWLKSHRNVTYCIDFNIVIRIWNTPVSAKMAQGQRKWRAVYIHSLQNFDIAINSRLKSLLV